MPGKSGKMKNHISGIYCITNKINGKRYIGQTKSCTTRWRQHLWSLRANRHSNPHLQHAFNKDGEDNLEYDILEECDLKDRDSREVFWINKYNTLDRQFGYNLETGGCENKNHSPETIKKIVDIRTGTICSDETKKKKSDAMKKLIAEGKWYPTPPTGRKLSEETKKKLSESKMGSKNPMYGKTPSEDTIRKRVSVTTGQKRSDEFRENASKRMTGTKATEEAKRNMSIAHLGIKKGPMSEEQKRKIGLANRKKVSQSVSRREYR